MAEKKVEIIENEKAEIIENPKAEKVEKAEITVSNGNTEIGNPFNSTEAFNKAYKMAQMFASSDMVPQNYQNKPMNCLIALEQAQRLGVSPMFVMQNMWVVRGKPTWSGSACASMVYGCGLFKNVKVNWVGEKGKDNYGCFISATRKDDDVECIGTTVDLTLVKAEGWYGQNPKWKNMFEQMCSYRAFSFFARIYCPNALSGFAVEGEIEDSETRVKKQVDNPF